MLTAKFFPLGIDSQCCERTIQVWGISFSLSFLYVKGLIMSSMVQVTKANMGEVLKKIELTPAQSKLFRIVAAGKGKLTYDLVHAAYQKATGKSKSKVGSIVTSMSQLRKKFSDAGYEYPAAWDVKKETGGGRARERTSIADLLNDIDLGEDFEIDLETVDTVAAE